MFGHFTTLCMKRLISIWRLGQVNDSNSLHQKRNSPLRISLVNVINPQKTADLFTFAKKNLNGKLHFYDAGKDVSNE